MKDRKLHVAITGLILSALLFTGCGSVAQDLLQTGSAGSSILSESGKPYKELTGKVVVFGTSIWANEPGPTGIASRLEALTSFQVTDYSMPGGLATRIEDDSFSDISLVSILLYNKDRYSKEMLDSIREADYVILAFGGNEHAMGIPASGEGESFENALLISVDAIRDLNPDVEIILLAPLNGWYQEDGEYFPVEDVDNGGGKRTEYVNAVESVAQKEGLLCIRMSEACVFSIDDPYKYFEDGSHLTDLGRKVYSEYLAEHIYDYYYVQDDDLE